MTKKVTIPGPLTNPNAHEDALVFSLMDSIAAHLRRYVTESKSSLDALYHHSSSTWTRVTKDGFLNALLPKWCSRVTEDTGKKTPDGRGTGRFDGLIQGKIPEFAVEWENS